MRTCPRCQRTNPADAVFCYFDGANLSASVAAETAKDAGRLPHEFVFPSGRRCKSYDDLVQAAQEEWETASELLREGAFRQFLVGAGRLDLARAAEEAKKHADADLALDAFLASLPATHAQKPRLDLEPRRLLLDPMRRGERKVVKLLVLNQGHGLLNGTITVTQGGDWLRLAGANEKNVLTVRTVREQVARIEVDARKLLAPQKFSGKLAVVTNGGIVEVAVRLTVLAHGFPRPPFQGAGSPRDMAVRMRGNPKAAIPMLETGEVARWFEANHWGYPVQGPTAPGMAAVQQFFEAMGLARAPQVELDEIEARYNCQHPEELAAQVVLQSAERKWVYAHADSDVHWLKVTTPTVSGPQKAVIRYVVDSSLLDPDRVHDGTLQVTGNGGQALSLRVRVDVRRGARAAAPNRSTLTAPPSTTTRVQTARPAPPPTRKVPTAEVPSAPTSEMVWPVTPVSINPVRSALIGAVAALLLRLLLAVPADLYARSAPVNWSLAPTDPSFVRHFTLATWWVGAALGAIIVGRRSSWSDLPFGLIAGAGAGAAGGATVACLLPLLDTPARILWKIAGGPDASAAATFGWLILAVGTWTVLGGVAGFMVGCAGRPGARFMDRVGAPMAWLLRNCGLKGLASFLTLS